MTTISTVFTLLGCGNAAGTPTVGDRWGQCDPNEPRNRRSRAAALVTNSESGLLIDFGPDICSHLIKSKREKIDAVLLSHNHGDHVNGIDDLRTLSFINKKVMPIYSRKSAIDELETRYPYALGRPEHELYKAFIETHYIKPGPVNIAGIDLTVFEQDHGSCISLGFRFGNMSYSTDMKALEDPAIEALKGIETWIVDGGAYKQENNLVHANIETVIALNQKIGARKVYLTHLPSNMDYKTVLNELPEGYEPAYDGLRIEI